MKLWSIQPLIVWEKLQKNGVLHTRANFVDQDFLPAYRWMAAQMQQRIDPAPHVNALPFWAWFQAYGAKQPKPDLRRRGHLPAGSSGVRLTLQMPSEKVLLSDFELWHYVLNSWYLPTSLIDGDRFEKNHNAKPATEQQAMTRKSWLRIFDLNFAAAEISDVYENKSLQATFWELTLDNVIEVQTFLAR